MAFPNARKGTGKLFTAEVMQIISVIFAVVGVFSFFVAMHESNSLSTDYFIVGSLGFIALIVIGVAIIMSIVVAVLKMVGLWQAGKDARVLRVAFWLIIAQIVFFGGITYVFWNSAGEWLGFSIFEENGIRITTIAGELISMAVFVITIAGLNGLVRRANRPGIAVLGWVVLALIAIAFVAIATAVLLMNSWTIVIVFAALAGLIIAYILYLIYLAKAKNAF